MREEVEGGGGVHATRSVMPGFVVPGIHALAREQGVDGRSQASEAMLFFERLWPGHDGG